MEEDENDDSLILKNEDFELEESPAQKYLKQRYKSMTQMRETEVNLPNSDDSDDSLEIRSYGATPEVCTTDRDNKYMYSTNQSNQIEQAYDQFTRKRSGSLLLRMDDTINDIKKINLSHLDDDTAQPRESISKALQDLFGKKLIPYYETYFTPFIEGRKYCCNQNMWNLEFLSNYHFDDSQMEISNIYSERFSHSFNYSYHKKENTKKGLDYLKECDSQVPMKDLLNFFDGSYYGSGIINTYLRILEVFHEYEIARQR